MPDRVDMLIKYTTKGAKRMLDKVSRIVKYATKNANLHVR